MQLDQDELRKNAMRLSFMTFFRVDGVVSLQGLRYNHLQRNYLSGADYVERNEFQFPTRRFQTGVNQQGFESKNPVRQE